MTNQPKTESNSIVRLWLIAFCLLGVGALFWYLYSASEPIGQIEEELLSRQFDIPEEKILRTIADRLLDLLRPPAR